MKELVIRALERELGPVAAKPLAKRAKLPQIRLRHGKKLDLTDFDFDDLLG